MKRILMASEEAKKIVDQMLESEKEHLMWRIAMDGECLGYAYDTRLKGYADDMGNICVVLKEEDFDNTYYDCYELND